MPARPRRIPLNLNSIVKCRGLTCTCLDAQTVPLGSYRAATEPAGRPPPNAREPGRRRPGSLDIPLWCRAPARATRASALGLRPYSTAGLGDPDTTFETALASNESTTATSYQYTSVSTSDGCV